MPASRVILALVCALLAGNGAMADTSPLKVWQVHEITLEASGEHANPYKDVEMWVQLQGPGFRKKVHGFWDGGKTWKVRVVATRAGDWSWTSHSSPLDAGLNGRQGSFRAAAWADADLQANPNRRGFIRPTPNGHALQYADGTPFFLMADTIWSASTRVPPFDWAEGAAGISFKDVVRIRRQQGYNALAFISAFPNWAEDGLGDKVVADGTIIRSHGKEWRTNQGADERGNRPVEMLPEPRTSGRPVVADFWRLNPAYFQQLDRRIAHLSAEGFVPFLETIRRDHGRSLNRWTLEWHTADV